ncbi:RNA-directed DNA polymerase from mobile element jockey [Stylophora pistillata]|uniref:RNA-directed DNA polymerase from mobile element jockey n=1 Tax=Stylophora pistillata TaxID=50429 RepID=A0A2B4S8Q3_STYPI|nr:RNA-directed DNA polymerase from mobile element jockey [Stylophora pistillata]
MYPRPSFRRTATDIQDQFEVARPLLQEKHELIVKVIEVQCATVSEMLNGKLTKSEVNKRKHYDDVEDVEDEGPSDDRNPGHPSVKNGAAPAKKSNIALDFYLLKKYVFTDYIMAFRSSENVTRNEQVRFRLGDEIRAAADGQHQMKTGYKFTVNDRSSFYDWYNAYCEVQFKVQKLSDGTAYGADRITVINGSHSLINHMMIKSGGRIAYDSNNLHKVTFVKDLLEYSDDYARDVAENSFWYLDTSADTRAPAVDRTVNRGFEARLLLTTANNDVNVIIPLNRYAFFAELEGRMLPPMQLEFNLTLQTDNEILVSTGLAGDGNDDGRVVLDRFFLWVPRLELKDSLLSKFVSEFQKPSDNNSSLTTCRLEYGNGIFYPETEFDSDSKTKKKLEKRRKSGEGMDIKLPNSNIRKQIGGGLLQSILPVVKALAPTVEPSYMDGSHWVATYVKDHVIHYFDSFGMPPFREIADHAKTEKGSGLEELLFKAGAKGLYNLVRIGATSQECQNSVYGPPELADAFNNHFSSIGPKLASQIYSNNGPSQLHYLELKCINPSKVFSLLSKLCKSKATGLDMISLRLLRECADLIADPMSSIFDQSIRSGVFSQEWKCAKVIPLFKEEDHSDLNNYRPISSVPIAAKVFERIMYDQVYGYLTENNLISSQQSGFRSLHSTVTALLEPTNNWAFNIDKGSINAVVFRDLKKAFDTIDHTILMSNYSNMVSPVSLMNGLGHT